MLAVKPENSAQEQVAQCQRLAKTLTITREMLVSAGNNEWEEVAELEKQRRDDLLACFSVSVRPADSELIAEAIAALLHLNEELMGKLQAARDLVMEEGASLSRNRQAADSYRTINSVTE